jgi:hypothetical protein
MGFWPFGVHQVNRSVANDVHVRMALIFNMAAAKLK